ncbi:hypothetical protein ACWIGI_33315 [Nocardia sp. NPDC055321]
MADLATLTEDTDSEPDSAATVPRTGVVVVSRNTLLLAIACAALVVVAAVLAVFLVSARDDLAAERTAAADRDRAEQLARDYAVGAATVDFQNLDAWLSSLKAGTASQLAAKFDATAPTLKEILVPLRWHSSASPIAATTSSENAGVYVVHTFVTVTSTSAQAAEANQTTVTYTVTLDKNDGWKIIDVGGLDGVMPTGAK